MREAENRSDTQMIQKVQDNEPSKNVQMRLFKKFLQEEFSKKK
jgi:hypothetical protein